MDAKIITLNENPYTFQILNNYSNNLILDMNLYI